MNSGRCWPKLVLSLHEKIFTAGADPESALRVGTNTKNKPATSPSRNGKALPFSIEQAMQPATVSADPNTALGVFGDRYCCFCGSAAGAARGVVIAFG